MAPSSFSLDMLSPQTLPAQFLQRFGQPTSFRGERRVLLDHSLISRLELIVRLFQGRNVPFGLFNCTLKAPPLSVAIRMGTERPGESVWRGGGLSFADQCFCQIAINSELERLARPSHEWGMCHPPSLT